MDIDGARLFVTGCGGFIATRLAEIAIERGATVRGIDASPAALARAQACGVEAWPAAVNDPPEGLAARMGGSDAVVNTAAIVAEWGDWAEFRRVNVDGARNVAAAAVAAGVPTLLQLSSVMVYGFDYPDGVAEDGPISGSANPYCTTKIEGEAALRALEPGALGVIVIRPGDVYGPGSVPWVLRPVELMRKRAFALPGGGRGRFNHTYVDNLVDGILLALERDAVGGVFNVTDGVSCSNAEYFGRLAEAAGVARPWSLPTWSMRALVRARGAAMRLRGREPDADVQAVRYLLRPGTYSTERAQRVLGYEPRVGLDEGIARVRALLSR